MIAVEGEEMIRMCCMCRKIEQEGLWEKQQAPHTRKVSHVYCPLCYEDLMDEIDRFALQRMNKSIYTVVHAVHPQGA